MKNPRNIKIGGQVAHPTGNNAHLFHGQRSRSYHPYHRQALWPPRSKVKVTTHNVSKSKSTKSTMLLLLLLIWQVSIFTDTILICLGITTGEAFLLLLPNARNSVDAGSASLTLFTFLYLSTPYSQWKPTRNTPTRYSVAFPTAVISPFSASHLHASLLLSRSSCVGAVLYAAHSLNISFPVFFTLVQEGRRS